jgi:hypothetical protein
MKRYKSTHEDSWIELLNVTITEEQKSILASENSDAINELKQLISQQSQNEVSAGLKETLINFYNSIKPELKENDKYELISIDIMETNNIFKGILNCRINNEHKQIRF